MTLELALKRQGCLTCASRIRELGGLATCLFWSSGYFGSTRLPRTGCEHWRLRDSVDATPEGAACIASGTGSKQKSPGECQGLFRDDEGACNTEIGLTTSGDRNRDG